MTEPTNWNEIEAILRELGAHLTCVIGASQPGSESKTTVAKYALPLDPPRVGYVLIERIEQGSNVRVGVFVSLGNDCKVATTLAELLAFAQSRLQIVPKPES